MIRRPPRSTLFPTRRSSDLALGSMAKPMTALVIATRNTHKVGEIRAILGEGIRYLRWMNFQRSEEHTSELQSQSNLVCRLLLEKKKREEFTSDTLAESTKS